MVPVCKDASPETLTPFANHLINMIFLYVSLIQPFEAARI